MLARLEPRALFLLAMAVCLMLLLGWYMLSFQGHSQEISLLRSELDTANTTAARYEAASQALPELRQKLRLLEKAREKFLQAMPPNAQFGKVLDDIQHNLSSVGAQLSSFTVQSISMPDLPAGVKPIALNLSVRGTFSAIFQALRSLETMSRFATVSTINLQLPQADSFNPTLEGTLTLTAYTFDQTQADQSTVSSNPSAPAEASPPPSAAGGTP